MSSFNVNHTTNRFPQAIFDMFPCSRTGDQFRLALMPADSPCRCSITLKTKLFVYSLRAYVFTPNAIP